MVRQSDSLWFFLLALAFCNGQQPDDPDVSQWVLENPDGTVSNRLSSDYLTLMTQLNAAVMRPVMFTSELEARGIVEPDMVGTTANDRFHSGLISSPLVPVAQMKWKDLLAMLVASENPSVELVANDVLNNDNQIGPPAKRFYYWNNGKKGGN